MSSSELRVGTDIQPFGEVSSSIVQFGSAYITRLFTAHEVESSGGQHDVAVPGLTARFAAKEAFFKVLRSPDLIPPWTSVEVIRRPGGWTDLRLHGTARMMADEAGISSLAVSLSHEGGFGMAVVIACVAPTIDSHPPPPQLTATPQDRTRTSPDTREMGKWTN